MTKQADSEYKLEGKKVNSLIGFAIHLRKLPEYRREWNDEDIRVEIERIVGSEVAGSLHPLLYPITLIVGVMLGAQFL